MRLRQIGRSPPQDLVLLLQQLDPPTRFPKLRALLTGRSGLGPVVDARPAHPLPQRHRVDSEVGGHLLDRHARAAVLRDPAQGKPVQMSPNRAADPSGPGGTWRRRMLVGNLATERMNTPSVTPRQPCSAPRPQRQFNCARMRAAQPPAHPPRSSAPAAPSPAESATWSRSSPTGPTTATPAPMQNARLEFPSRSPH